MASTFAASTPSLLRRKDRSGGGGGIREYDDEETALRPLERDLAEIENSSDRGIRTFRSGGQIVVVKEDKLSGQIAAEEHFSDAKKILREADPRLTD